jgi:hypothetical protein
MGHLRLTEKNWEKQFLIKVRHCQINYVELLKIKKKISMHIYKNFIIIFALPIFYSNYAI